jgi:hypothetical protein
MFLEKHVMYFCVITLDDPDNKNRILCKIGYSCDFFQRFKDLKKEYKCNFYLLNIKLVNSVKDEIKFHDMIKSMFPELHVIHKIKNIEKEETYVFDLRMYNQFYRIDKVKIDKNKKYSDDDIDDDVINELNNYFNDIEKRFELEILKKLNKFTDIPTITNSHQENAIIKGYDYMINYLKYGTELSILKENNRHIESMKKIEADVELKKIQFDIEKIHLEDKKLEFEISKIKSKK